VKPEEVMLIRLRKEVETELSGLERLRKEHAGVPVGNADGYMLRARASILHDRLDRLDRLDARFDEAFLRLREELRRFLDWLLLPASGA
jgi:hypothetical protein